MIDIDMLREAHDEMCINGGHDYYTYREEDFDDFDDDDRLYIPADELNNMFGGN